MCGKKGGLCAIAFLDGSQKDRLEDQLKVVEATRAKKHPSPYSFAWVDAACHPDFASSLDITSDNLPTIAVSPEPYTLQGCLAHKKHPPPTTLQ